MTQLAIGFALVTLTAQVTLSSLGCVERPTVIEASDYDQQCQFATDCIVVQSGDACEPECTKNATIRGDEAARYAEDVQTFQASFCPAVDWSNCGTSRLNPVCSGGRCLSPQSRSDEPPPVNTDVDGILPQTPEG